MKNKRIILGLLGLFCLGTIAVASLGTFKARGQQESNKSQDNPVVRERSMIHDSSKYPVVDYYAPQPTDLREREDRAIKSSRYDTRWNFVLKNPNPNSTGSSFNDESPPPPAIPTVESDLVVIGQVLTASAYMSNNRQTVYSEFGIRIDEILKPDGSRKIVPAEIVTLDRMGGRVRYPSGQEMTYEMYRKHLPDVGGSYLFFLTKDRISPNYQILSAYKIADLSFEPLDRDTPIDDLKFRNKSEFLQTVRTQIELKSTKKQ